jgi:hypothetical protein
MARLILVSLRAQEASGGDIIPGAAFYDILDGHPFQYIKFFLQVLGEGQGGPARRPGPKFTHGLTPGRADLI